MKTLHLNKNLDGRDFVCGDLHGSKHLLLEKLDKVNFNPSIDRVFCVGDLIDRGIDSIGTLKLLNESWFFSVQGNHERMFMTWFDPKNNPSTVHSPTDFLRNGGDWAINISSNELQECAQIIKKMPLIIWVKDEFVVTHARLNSLEKNPDKFVWFRGMECFDQDDPSLNFELPVFVGHTPVKEVGFVGSHIMIDTGAVFKNGKLTLVEVSSVST